MFALKTQNQKRKKTLIIDFFYYYFFFYNMQSKFVTQSHFTPTFAEFD